MSLKEVFSGILSNDIGRGSGSRLMIILIFVPPALILLVRLGFHPLAEVLGDLTGKNLSGYYSLAAMIAIAVISVVPGIFFGFGSIKLRYSASPSGHPFPVLPGRMLISFLSSLVLLIAAGFLTDPVPSEGKVRLLFSVLLFAVQSVVVLIFIISFSRTYLQALICAKLFSVFLLAAPLGLVLNSPWNLLAFFSPFYWISWAWLTEIPSQSLLYGMIASGISAAIMLLAGIRMKKMIVSA